MAPPPAAVNSAAVVDPAPSIPTRAKVTAAATGGGTLSAFLGLPGAPATSAPTINANSIKRRLNLDDIFGGEAKPTVTDPQAVVTGLFRQVLREDPTPEELQNYLRVYNRSGVNGVVAGLYSSTQFRQTQVNNYYLELLGRNASDGEKGRGASKLIWGQTEPMFAASIAGSPEFYTESSSLGGPNGVLPSANTFVGLLYRSMLGQVVNPIDGPIYVQQTQAGTPTSVTARQFVTANPFRTVKVGEIFTVLGADVNSVETKAAIKQAVDRWLRNGGLAGIATSGLASAENIAEIQKSVVPLPNAKAVEQLTTLLLTAYTQYPDVENPDKPIGFTKLLKQYLTTDPATGAPCPGDSTCNTELLTFIRTGGATRGTPNTSLTATAMAVDVQALIPTQNEVAFRNSLRFPLTDPTTLGLYFKGGIITPPGGTDSTSTSVLTSDGGKYIVDGHHRWSAIFVINPNAQVTAIDINYVPNPQTGLKETQLGIAAQLETVKVAVATGINLFTVKQPVFDAEVFSYVVGTFVNANDYVTNWDPNAPHTDEELKKYQEALQSLVNQPAVGNIFSQNLGLGITINTATDPYDVQVAKLTAMIPGVNAYLWKNVEQMRRNNQFVTGAPTREVMPQAEPIAPILQYMTGGTLSYSFPLVSYLG